MATGNIMSSIFGAFRGGQPQNVNPNPGTPMPQPQQQSVSNNPQNNPAPQNPQTGPGTDKNGVIPGDGSAQAEQKSPLEVHKTLWEPVKPEENQTPPGSSPEEIQQKMLEAAGKVDFSKVMDQELLSKIAAGGPEAVQALVGVLNKTAQTVYAQSALVSHKLVEQAVDAAKTDFAKQVPELVKRNASRSSLLEENPAFNNPVLQPIVMSVQTQLAQKYPKATSAELNSMAKEVLKGAAELINPPQKAASDPRAQKEEDWSAWLN